MNEVKLATPEQVFSLGARFVTRVNSLRVSEKRIKDAINNGNDPLWEVVDSVLSTSFDHLSLWTIFYHTYFGLTTDLSGIRIPAKKDGFDRLIVVAKGMSINLVYETGKKNFGSWKWCGDEDLESQMQESERGLVKESYAFWVRDNQEADEDLKNWSAQMIANSKEKIDTENLLERLLHGFKYWSETRNHLDISTITLCASSRCVDGYVPFVARDCVGCVDVDGYAPGFRRGALRARRVVR